MKACAFVLVAAMAGMVCPAAHALGILRAPEAVALGAPLNFAVTVRVAPDEQLTSTCVTADVQQGERRIQPSTIRIGIEPGPTAEERLVRVLSTSAIDEPVITVTLTLGCTNQLERRFTVLADPPLVTVAAAAPAVEPAVATARPESPVSAPVESAPAGPASAGGDAASGGSASARTDTEGERRAAPTQAAPAPTARPRMAATTRPQRSASAAATVTRRPARRATTVAAAGVAPAAQVAASAPTPRGPRLQLDAIEPAPRGAASAPAASAMQDSHELQLRTVAAAASAAAPVASAVESAASAALDAAALTAERMRAIEDGMTKLRADIERDREQMVTLRAKLARAEGTSRLAPWLGVGMALLAALALWLWLRMRRMQREQQAQWWAASRAAQNSRLPPANPPTLHPMTLPPQMAPASTRVPQGDTVAAVAQPVRPSAAPAAPAGGFRDSVFPPTQQPPRDVSIEELIDLEQQAEFFVVLGQDDAAIDLLMSHIRGSGGTSPLPYLKLLEIYRRRGDRSIYERTRERFNHRFNAYAPDWDADLQHGRSLDEYPRVMKRLEGVWHAPIDAMAELEALMFRRDGGEPFELPAYREVLFLYSMARDLLDHEGGPPSSIDVLLPLGGPAAPSGGEFEPTTARPHLFTSVGGLASLGDPPAASSEPAIEVLRASGAVPAAGDEASNVYGTVDLDPTSPVPIDDTVVLGRDDTPERLNPEQRSDFADLPLPPSPKPKG
ncbi:MAG: hypothetical protein HS106_15230 [Ideonella sp.]|nr:hypothetical protein [Ideonella sp.]MBE7427349.1 hypothetical protein [Ideonella sp.]MCC7459385.1 hypothetical protein [Nitrospira sp.]